MLVLIDESGDCGLKFDKGSSEFFTCIAVLFRDGMAADACDRSIDGLRYQLKKPRTYEFHFSHCSDRIRRAFLETVSQDDFRYAGFVLEKRKLYGDRFTNPKELYEFAVTLACDHLKLHLENAKVIIDKNGDREFKKRLERSLTANMVDAEGNCRLRKVTMEASHTNNLVQLADMICGAVGRSFTGQNDTFRALVKSARSSFSCGLNGDWGKDVPLTYPIGTQTIKATVRSAGNSIHRITLQRVFVNIH